MSEPFKSLEHLFDAEMVYRGQEAMTSSEGKVGQYVGSGDGSIAGKINGTIRWDLYEAIDHKTCLTNFAGIIETLEGDVIRYDARGHGKVPDPTSPHEWVMVYGVKFETDSEAYHWLNATLAVWEGEFNMETYRHTYRIYAHVNR